MTQKFSSRPRHSDFLGTVNEEGEIETSVEYNLFFDDLDFSLNELLGDSFKLTSYQVLGVPDPTKNEGGIIFITNESGPISKIPAWSDGTNWRRFTDGAIIT